MIYRIAIYRHENGQRKFDHYATERELLELRVSADGKVEKIESAGYRSELPSPNLPCFKTGEWVAEDEYYHGSIYSQWLDVSSTHEVEWGVHQKDGGSDMYLNDIFSNSIATANKGVVDIAMLGVVMHQSRYSTAFEPWIVYGTVHDPELMRGKDE